MKNQQDIIQLILTLPERFMSQRDKSFNQLLKETGYFQNYDQIHEEDILDAINQYPEIIKNWFIWSENKRTRSGWFIKESKGKYIVSFFSNLENKIENKKEFRTNEIKKACAYFIKKEVDSTII